MWRLTRFGRHFPSNYNDNSSFAFIYLYAYSFQFRNNNDFGFAYSTHSTDYNNQLQANKTENEQKKVIIFLFFDILKKDKRKKIKTNGNRWDETQKQKQKLKIKFKDERRYLVSNKSESIISKCCLYVWAKKRVFGVDQFCFKWKMIKHTHTHTQHCFDCFFQMVSSGKEINNLFGNVGYLCFTFILKMDMIPHSLWQTEKVMFFRREKWYFFFYTCICNSSTKSFLTIRCGSIYDWCSTRKFMHFIEIRNYYYCECCFRNVQFPLRLLRLLRRRNRLDASYSCNSNRFHDTTKSNRIESIIN